MIEYLIGSIALNVILFGAIYYMSERLVHWRSNYHHLEELYYEKRAQEEDQNEQKPDLWPEQS